MRFILPPQSSASCEAMLAARSTLFAALSPGQNRALFPTECSFRRRYSKHAFFERCPESLSALLLSTLRDKMDHLDRLSEGLTDGKSEAFTAQPGLLRFGCSSETCKSVSGQSSVMTFEEAPAHSDTASTQHA